MNNLYPQSEHFPFLGINNSSNAISDMRCRTTFYTSLGRLLLVDLGEDEEKFYQFMMPLTGLWFLLLIKWLYRTFLRMNRHLFFHQSCMINLCWQKFAWVNNDNKMNKHVSKEKFAFERLHSQKCANTFFYLCIFSKGHKSSEILWKLIVI